MKRRTSWVLVVGAFAVAGCGGGHPAGSAAGGLAEAGASAKAPANSAATATVPSSAHARDLIAHLQSTFRLSQTKVPPRVRALNDNSLLPERSLLPPGTSSHFAQQGGGLVPQFGGSGSAGSPPPIIPPAQTSLPNTADGALDVRDAASGLSIAITLTGTSNAAVEVANGYVVYPSAYEGGADVLNRPYPSGTEQSLAFATKPSAERVIYNVALGAGVAGVRWVANTVEFLDVRGAPRLRMAPPYIAGAGSTFAWPAVTVKSCAVDTNPAPPWGRTVVRPGASSCEVTVDWSGAGIQYPALLDPSWTVGSTMATARMRHAGARVAADGAGANGKELALVFGGYAFTSTIASAELFDETSGTWAQTGSLVADVAYAPAVALNDGTALSVGGYRVTGSDGVEYDGVQLYNPTTGTWTLQGHLGSAREGHSATLLSSGSVLVAGGFGGSLEVFASALLYNPLTGTASPAGNMQIARGDASATLLGNGKVLVVDGLGANAKPLSVADLYSPTANTWSAAAPPPLGARFSHVAPLLPSGKVLVAGGEDLSSGIAQTLPTAIYDPGANAWSNGPPTVGSHYLGTATVLTSGTNSGKVLLGGGDLALDGVELFDPTASTWTAIAPLSTGRDAHVAVLLTNGLLFAGGSDSDGNLLSSAELYQPDAAAKNPQWSASASLSVAVQGTSAALSWSTASDPSGIASYVVYENGQAVAAVSGSSQSYTVTGLTPSARITFAVQAVNQNGVSTWNGPASTNQCNGAAFDTSNPCTVGTCDPVKGAVYGPAAVGSACAANSNACVGAFICNESQQCVQGPTPVPTPPNRCYTASCDPTTGFSYTPIDGCNAAPLMTDNPFETHASVMGIAQAADGSVLSGFSVTITDMPGSAARTDLVVSTASDGSFRAQMTTFPASEPPQTPPHHEMVRIESASTIPVLRDVYLHAGQAVDLGVLTASLRDSKVTMIGPGGGTASDSHDLVEVDIPAGVLASATPIVITPHPTRAEVPLRLPDSTVTTYAMTLEPDGMQFSSPVTVRVSNSLNLPTSSAIPVGYAETSTAIWRSLGIATWDGSRFAFQTSHFSGFDVNYANPYGVLLISYGSGTDPTQSAGGCMGSSVGFANGALKQSIPLPTYQSAGQSYDFTLAYNSMQAGLPVSQPAPSSGSNAPPGPGYGAVPQSSTATTARSGVVSATCVPRSAADSIVAGSPGTCLGGACQVGGGGGAVSTVLPFNSLANLIRWNGSSSSSQTISIPSGAVDVELPPSGSVPLASNGSPSTAFFAQRHVEVTAGGGGSCVSAGGGGGTGPVPVFGVTGSGSSMLQTNQQSGPLVSMDEEVFINQGQVANAGAGWGVGEVERLYSATSADLAVIVHGNGDQETFSPRAELTVLPNNTTSTGDYALALDPTTGQILLATPAEIDLADPTTGILTAVLSGLDFPSDPMAMAIAYVGGVRHFIVALHTELVDITDGSASMRVLMPRTPVNTELAGGLPVFAYVPAVAAENDLAFYVSGDWNSPILYRFRLSDASPVPEALTEITSGDASLDPGVPLGQITLGDPHGLAYVAGKGLYIADRRRDVVYLAAPAADGEVGMASSVTRAIGAGGSTFIPPLGYRFAGPKFPLNQPFTLATTADGSLWISAPFGFAIYDLQSGDARWVFFDSTVNNSESTYALRSVDNKFTSVPVGPSSIFAINAYEFRIDISLLSSQLDPTRTIAVDATGSTLTDTTQDTVERFDSNGLVTSLAKRTGASIYSMTYVPSTDRVATIVDGRGGTTQFGYDVNGKLQTIAGPSGATTRLAVGASGDLTSITEPDGEMYSFTYTNHQMTSKTSPDGDVTMYTYGSDGTISSTSKPAPGDHYSVASAYSQPSQRDAQGNTIHVGTYTDPRGVTHTITVNHHGQVQSDSYTADGQSYAVQYVEPATLGGVGDLEQEFSPRRNNLLERVSYTTVNGLIMGREKWFDEWGRVKYTSDGNPGFTGTLDTFEYDSNGRISSFQPGPGDDQFNIDRDSSGNPIRIFENSLGSATGNEVDYTWNGPNGQADTITRHGVTTTVTFDTSTKNPSTFTDTMGRTSALTYDALGNVSTAFDGQTTRSFTYDANNRLTAVTDADGNASTFGYAQSSCGCSQASLVTSIHTPDLATGLAWTMTYGPEGRLATLTDPDGHQESYAYEPTGELRSLTDRLSRTTQIGHDHLGRIQSILDALGRTYQQSYLVPTSTQSTGANVLAGSASGTAAATDLTATLNAGDYQIGTRDLETHSADGQSLYGTLGVPQVSFYRDATQQISYGLQFDDALRLTRREDRSGLSFAGEPPLPATGPMASGSTGSYTQTIQTWTPLLPIPVLQATEDLTSSSTYSSASFNYNAQYDLMGQQGYVIASGVSGETEDTFMRDTAGRLTGLSQTYVDGTAFVTPPPCSYTYEPTSDRLATVNDVDGEHDFTYDDRGLLHTLKANEGTYTFGYDTLGRNQSLTYPDGHQRVQRYDAEGRLTSRCYEYGDAGVSRCYGATYDAVGNPITMTDPEGTDTYQYDALYRVTSVMRQPAGGSSTTESYGYNALGALNTNAPETTGNTLDDQRPIFGSSGGGSKAPSAVMNAVNGASVSVDPAGRVTGLAGATLVFGKQNLLMSVSGSGASEAYLYDSQFRRFARHFGTNIEYYVYEGPNVVGRLNQDGSIADTYLYDGVDSPLRMARQMVPYYYEVDLAGNVRRLRGAGGADLGGYRYTAFGQLEAADTSTPAPSVDQALRWKARWLVPAAGGIYDVRARWWSPQMGAFLSVDELAYHDPNSTLWGWPRQNPLHWSDPSGRWGFTFGGTVSAEWGIGLGIGAGFTGGFYIGSGGFGAFNTLSSAPVAASGSIGEGISIGFYYGDTPGGPSTQVSVSGGDGLLGSASIGNSGVSVTLGAGVGASVSVSDSQTAVEGLDWSGNAVSTSLALCK